MAHSKRSLVLTPLAWCACALVCAPVAQAAQTPAWSAGVVSAGAASVVSSGAVSGKPTSAGAVQAVDLTEKLRALGVQPGDEVFAGDWNKDGTAGFGVRRGSKILLAESDDTEVGQYATYSFGGSGGTAVVGHWGSQRDTVAIRDENRIKLRRWYTNGKPDRTFTYGEAGDQLLVGDWQGSSYDGPAVRRGNKYLIRYLAHTGAPDVTVEFGPTGGTALTGDFDGDGKDGLAVVDGSTVVIRDDLGTSTADRTMTLPVADAQYLAADFDGDGVTDIGYYSPASSGQEAAGSSSTADSSAADSSAAGGSAAAGAQGSSATPTVAPSESVTTPSVVTSPTAQATATSATATSPTSAASTTASATQTASGETTTGHGFEKVVGKDLVPGVYRIISRSEDCSLSVLYSDDKTQSGRVQGGENAQVYLTLGDGDAITVSGCEISKATKDTTNMAAAPLDGEWLAGVDVPVGKYLVAGKESCFATVLEDTTRDADIVQSFDGKTTSIVVKEGQLISTEGCTWSKLPD